MTYDIINVGQSNIVTKPMGLEPMSELKLRRRWWSDWSLNPRELGLHVGGAHVEASNCTQIDDKLCAESVNKEIYQRLVGRLI